MIFCDDKVFLLKNKEIAYLLRIGKYGHVEHLHFGAPVELSDWQALTCRPGLGWGGSVVLEDSDSESCLDDRAMEWSGSGRGDYRESPLEIGSSTDLRYVNHRILNGIAPMAGSLPQARGDCQTLELVLEQPGLRVKLYYSLFDTALTRRTVVENTGDAPLTLGKIMSFSMDLPGQLNMMSFHGGWICEMRKAVTPVTGGKVVSESLTGASSNRANPGFVLFETGAGEEHGRVYGFNLVYSGNHYASAQRSYQGLNRVMQGINPSNFAWELAPGEIFETPEAVMTVSDEGFNGMSARMHRFVSEHIVPAYWRNRPRPVLFNSWEGCMFDFNQSRLLKLADQAKHLGCELFVLDDGWFGKRNDDRSSLGDYTVNAKKLPGGLAPLADKIRGKGLEFGLWFEPESVSPDSELYRAHPDWALTDGHPDILGRHQLLLDLTKQEVRDYIVESVGGILDSAKITYVKWDMNRHSIALGAKAHSFVLGVYEVMRRIFAARPKLLLENCSSGGNRFDLGMLCYSPQIWASDNTDPVERLTIQGNLSYLYPQSTFGAHVSAAPHAQTLRNTPLYTRGNVAFFGCLGYELDLKHLLPVEIQEVREQVAFYKQYRQVFQYGRFRRTGSGWQVSYGGTTIVGVFHKLVSAVPEYEQLRVAGLKKDARYHLESRAQSLRMGQFGSLLKHVSPVDINPNGALLRTLDAHKQLPDGVEEFTLTGAALCSGIMLQPRFRGTGYDGRQRTQGDFGSNLYVIEEIEE